MVSLHPEMGYGLVEHLKEYISLGAKGLKFHSSVQELEADNVALAEVYEYCEEISFPILFHCGLVSEETTNNYSDIEMLLPIIERYRNIPIILGHMAEGKIEDVLWLAQAHSNVFFDTSITISGLHCIKRVHDDCWQDDDVVIEVIKKIGADRILFGSDYPFGSPIHDINRLIQMDISDLDKKLILGGNAIRLFGIESNRLPTN
jgi:predicted TIM-barrel fold metal-dependent hydrolase